RSSRRSADRGLWGALTRFRFGEACGDRRVVRPSPESEELVLVLVALLPGAALPAPARLAASSLAGLQGARDRRTSTRARGASPAETSAAVDDDGSGLPYSGESVIATVALA